MNARYQNPTQGQFISQDPVARDIGMIQKRPWYILDVNQSGGTVDQTSLLSNPQMLNSYSYAINNPITKSDPSGEFVPLLVVGGFALAAFLVPDQVVYAPTSGNMPSSSIIPTNGVEWTAFGLGMLGGPKNVAKNEAYEVAKAGGRHAGWMKIQLDKSVRELESGIKNFEKLIQEHTDKIKNPEKYYPDWNKLDPREQKANLEKILPGQIQRQTEQKNILQGVLDSKKDGK